ncbi:MAG: bifunctional 4-hydroxy-3-methylbut-2-enyl diphosphate reductase/30S ribosomal protein S1 [Oscillospiraceae bacterium]|nr:bifunctional 4-hydroxy-3-methylbut-2-enyl diphosphate reductase/30S ribosomal protein S1 [Oscillospiraceae bacterium]
MKIKLAKSAGYCYGVSRAVSLCHMAAERYSNCVTLGPIIHNEHVVADLKDKGVRVVSNIFEVKKDHTVIIRSHGASRAEHDALKSIGANVIDATCPDVKKIHDIAQKESQAGRLIIIIGQRNHPEVTAISGWCDKFIIFENDFELKEWLKVENNTQIPISVVFQTTGTKQLFDSCGTIIKKECTNHNIFDTICNATYHRQSEALEISKIAEAVCVIGDKNSANSHKLAKVCKEHCAHVFFIQNADELKKDAFSGFNLVGITAGASTPPFIIKEVIAKMSMEENKQIVDGITAEDEVSEAAIAASADVSPVPEEKAEKINEAADVSDLPPEEPAPAEDLEESESDGVYVLSETAEETDALSASSEISENTDAKADHGFDSDVDFDIDPDTETFEEMLEKSIKTLRTGEKVTGTITSITSTEVSVDLGAKQSAYIPTSEFLDEEHTDINEVIKIGDEIESFVMRVNDVEGMIMLSKKRLDAAKNLDMVEAARANREVVSGFVIQENRGGVVVNVKGVHVFVPASQSGLPKNASMTELLKKNVKLRINEVNQSRRRVVGSIRDAQKHERREKSDKVWSEIEVGKKYDGVVKSMTSYGVFVDIGGVDGMIHISELSWTRIKQPSEILALGDEIAVYVISFDRENRKISLGYKKGEDNPWTKFTADYSVGDIINVKIVKMMPFGAFAEICTGVDGLIHISQISDQRIGLPSEVLKVDQMVDVKITEIDNERKKVSLSIKALSDSEMRLPDSGFAEETDAAIPADATDEEPAPE